MSVAADILALIRAHPGIRSVEVEQRLDIVNCASKIQHHITAGRIRSERVQAPNGKWVTAYYPEGNGAEAEQGMATSAPPRTLPTTARRGPSTSPGTSSAPARWSRPSIRTATWSSSWAGSRYA